jgi:DNA topoisomerase III
LFAPLATDDEADDSKLADEQEPVQPLPILDQGEGVTCAGVSIADRYTARPKRFTDASLIQAMTGIARYVHDPKIKQALRETDGIETPATQAAIIQTLFNRRFIEKRGRQVFNPANSPR